MGELGSAQMRLTFQSEAARRAGDLAAAVPLLEQLVAILREHLELAAVHNRAYPDPVETDTIARPLINTLTTLADHLQSLGEVQRSNALREEAHGLAREHFGEAGAAEEQRRRAASLTAEGRFAEALTALAAARDFFEAERDLVQMARVTIDSADLLQWLGDFERATSLLDHAAATIAPELADGPPTAARTVTEVLAGLLDIQQGKGDGSRAVRAVELHRIATELRYYRGLLAKAREDYPAAERFFRSVREDYARLGVAEAVDYQLADVLRRQGRHRESLEIVRRLEPTFRGNQQFRPKYAALLMIAGEAQLAAGDAPGAVERARTGAADLERYHDPDLRWKLQGLEGRALAALGREDEALLAFERAAQTIAGLRIAPLGYRLDSTYLRDKRELFDAAIRTALARGRCDAFCALTEQIKSRNLATVLSRPAGVDAPDSALTGRLAELSRAIDALEYQRYAGGQGGEARRETLLRERAAVLERLRAEDACAYAVTAAPEWSLGDLERRLDGLAVLNLFVDRDRVMSVLLLPGGESRCASMPWSAEISGKVDAYAANLAADSPDPLDYDISRSRALGARHLVEAELLAEALRAPALVVVPHGPLHLLPWAGLIFEGRRLFQYCPVGILPNLRVLTQLRGRESVAAGPALVIGAPDYRKLPGLAPLKASAREVQALEELYGRDGHLRKPALRGAKVTEDAVRSLLADAAAAGARVHFGCHGMPQPTEPLNAGLLLTDSRLDAAEIARLHLPEADVVLSACNTGWRPTQVNGLTLEGDEILGLPAAFLEAGASSVLVSIPQADDEGAADLTVKYHAHLVAGASPMRALQAAQLEMLEGPHDPWAWIGFCLYGCR